MEEITFTNLLIVVLVAFMAPLLVAPAAEMPMAAEVMAQ